MHGYCQETGCTSPIAGIRLLRMGIVLAAGHKERKRGKKEWTSLVSFHAIVLHSLI